MSPGEFRAIQQVLQSGKRSAQRNKTWTRLHEETGAGSISGRLFLFDKNDLQRLRDYARNRFGLDPLFDSTNVSRMEMADKNTDEKRAGKSVFGELLLFATAGTAELTVSGRSLSAPPGSILSVKPECVDREVLKQTKLLLIENGSLMTEAHRIRLPDAWRDCVLLYRGHGENLVEASDIVRAQPAQNLAVYFDCDPEGLELALQVRKGTALLPDIEHVLSGNHKDLETVNQRSVFRRQSEALKRLKAAALIDPWKRVLHAIEAHELAIMQEHLTSHGFPLITVPIES
jgi:hypothetical protein